MVTAQCIKTTFVSRDIYKYWKIYLTRVLEKTYLVQREPPMQRELADYLNQFCQHELSQENLKRFSIIILRQNSFNVFIAGPKDCRNTLFHTIISKAVVTFNEDSELTKYECLLIKHMLIFECFPDSTSSHYWVPSLGPTSRADQPSYSKF